jgi:hypothetical protein
MGVIFCVLAWVIITVMDYKQKFDGLCFDCDNDFGFPFKVYQSGGLMQATKIVWTGILGNFVVISISSILIGFIIFRLFGRDDSLIQDFAYSCFI